MRTALESHLALHTPPPPPQGQHGGAAGMLSQAGFPSHHGSGAVSPSLTGLGGPSLSSATAGQSVGGGEGGLHGTSVGAYGAVSRDSQGSTAGRSSSGSGPRAGAVPGAVTALTSAGSVGSVGGGPGLTGLAAAVQAGQGGVTSAAYAQFGHSGGGGSGGFPVPGRGMGSGVGASSTAGGPVPGMPGGGAVRAGHLGLSTPAGPHLPPHTVLHTALPAHMSALGGRPFIPGSTAMHVHTAPVAMGKSLTELCGFTYGATGAGGGNAAPAPAPGQVTSGGH